MELNETVDHVELSKIIKSLISFIVVDGKKFVTEENRAKYTTEYIYTLTKSMNGDNNFVNFNHIKDVIEQDISNIMNKKIN